MFNFKTNKWTYIKNYLKKLLYNLFVVIGSIALVFNLLYAKQDVMIIPYFSYTTYSSASSKKELDVDGVFGSLIYDKYKFDIAIERAVLRYKIWPNLKQFDIAYLFSYYGIYPFTYKIGLHHILSNDKESNNAFIVTSGLKWEKETFGVGINTYLSFYKNYLDHLDKKDVNYLKLFQISPEVTLKLNKKKGIFTLNSIGGEFNFIKVNGIKTALLQKHYQYFAFKCDYTIGALFAKLRVWTGKKSFAIEQNGFVVYNSADLYKKGISNKFYYQINKKSAISIHYDYAKFKGIYKSKDAYLQSVGGSFIYKF